MRHRTFISLLLAGLFSAAFVAGAGRGVPPVPGSSVRQGGAEGPEAFADSLRSVWYYTEGVKRQVISSDSVQARELFREAIRRDSTFAPAYFALALHRLAATPDEVVALARRARDLDTANIWYERYYGQSLLMASRYSEALPVYRQLVTRDPKDPDNYRLLAALYEQAGNPYMALTTLDSAELRFGRIPLLGAMKRRLLISTNQIDKAIEEARALVDEAPYDQEHRTVLASLYGVAKQDSLARAEYEAALKIDSTDVATLMSLSDYYNDRSDYRSLLEVSQRLFRIDEFPLATKISRFNIYTADRQFYREFYPQINALALTLAIRYPQDPRVVELYAQHLLASGEIEHALEHYKLHLNDTPVQQNYYRQIIDIESYLQRADSVDRYVTEALRRFPGSADFHIARGNIDTYAERYEEAARKYREALRYADTDSLRSFVWGLVGDSYHQRAEQVLGRTLEQQEAASAKERKAMRRWMRACYDAYEHSLRYNAENALVLNNYAYFLSLAGERLDEALRMAELAVRLSGSNPTYLDTQAWVLYRSGRYAEAKKIMQQAIALDGRESAELLVHYGDILLALDEKFLAETFWRKALEKGYDADQIERRINGLR